MINGRYKLEFMYQGDCFFTCLKCAEFVQIFQFLSYNAERNYTILCVRHIDICKNHNLSQIR